MRHGTCFHHRLSAHHAGAAPHSAVAELGVVRRRYGSTMNFAFDWTVITMTGSTIVSTTGWVKTVFEIRKLQRELRASKTVKESVIYVPESTEERIRYGSSRIRTLTTFAVVCGIASLASASIAIPAIAAKLGEAQQVRRERDALQQKGTERLFAPPEHPLPNEILAPIPPDETRQPARTSVPETPTPPTSLTPQPPPTPPPTNLPPQPDFPPQNVQDLNEQFLKGIFALDYSAVKRTLDEQARKNITATRIKNWGLDFREARVFNKDYLGAIPVEQGTLHVWRLTRSDRRATVIETIVISHALSISQASFTAVARSK